jgi:hypothetical protein
MFKS